MQNFQIIALKRGMYKGIPDNLWGPATVKALRKAGISRKWSRKRQWIGGIQKLLNDSGYNAGSVDGYEGHLTSDAWTAFIYKEIVGKEIPEPDSTVLVPSKPNKMWNFPHQRDVKSFYGNPSNGPHEISRQLVRIDVYPMVLDWKLRQSVSTISVHKKCAYSAQAAFIEIERVYGVEKLTKLGLHRFAGSYNHRKMRGGSSWSMHAYGCAIDFFARPNGLRTRCPDALFCGPEYKAFFDIWEDHGWTSLGRAIGRDWMHVQAADL